MKNRCLFTLLAFLLPHMALADCRDIVERTVAETRAGSSEWNEDMERLVRSAAGSACVKAGNDDAAPASSPSPLNERAVVPAAAPDSTATANVSSSEDSQQSVASEEKDEDWHPLKGFKFNPVTGSPGKKPYERRREVYETEAERERDADNDD